MVNPRELEAWMRKQDDPRGPYQHPQIYRDRDFHWDWHVYGWSYLKSSIILGQFKISHRSRSSQGRPLGLVTMLNLDMSSVDASTICSCIGTDSHGTMPWRGKIRIHRWKETLEESPIPLLTSLWPRTIRVRRSRKYNPNLLVKQDTYVRYHIIIYWKRQKYSSINSVHIMQIQHSP